MREVVLILGILLAMGASLFNPFAGIIVWTWFSVQSPQDETWSFARSLPLNLIIAVVTILVWLVSKERKLPPSSFIIWAMFAFLAWITFNGFFAFDPQWSWIYWDRIWKIFALALLIAVLATNPVRINTIVWICVLSLFYYGVRGGLFTILTGGKSHVVGPPSSEIFDNNTLALALLMILPLANYLRTRAANRYVSLAMLGGMGLTLVSIIGSYSRGGLIGLGALGLAGLLRSRRRVIYLVTAFVFGAAVLGFMPQSFWDRASTIGAADQDKSFQTRLMSWEVAYDYARDHFPFGAGIYAVQLPGVYNTYFPGQSTHAAHSIYFQVLGENGFVGLAIYLVILAAAFLQCSRLMRRARGDPELAWLGDLARMIQLSLIAFCVAGAALSMAYYDLFAILVCLLVPMSEIAARAKTKGPKRVVLSPALPGAAPAELSS